jgi:hypothetical protein
MLATRLGRYFAIVLVLATCAQVRGLSGRPSFGVQPSFGSCPIQSHPQMLSSYLAAG